MSTQVMMNSENVCPQENNIQSLQTVATKPVNTIQPTQEVAKVATLEVAEQNQAPVATEQQQVAEELVEEEGSFVEDSEDESEDELEEDEVDDETFGEQTEVVSEPLSLEEEAKAAAQLAQSFGLDSTDDALRLIGRAGTRRMTNVISTYSQEFTKEPEVVPFYDSLSERINALRQSLDASLTKTTTELGYTLAVAGIELIRGQMELFIREVLRQGSLLAEYRQSEEVSSNDLLQSLSNLGRPLYFEPKEANISAPNPSNDESDSEFQPEDDEDDENMDEDCMEEDLEESDNNGWEQVKNQQSATEDDESSKVTVFERSAFHNVVDVLRSMAVSGEGYEVIQTATENYIVGLIGDCSRSAEFVGKKEIGGDEVRFVLKMTGK